MPIYKVSYGRKAGKSVSFLSENYFKPDGILWGGGAALMEYMLLLLDT